MVYSFRRKLLLEQLLSVTPPKHRQFLFDWLKFREFKFQGSKSLFSISPFVTAGQGFQITKWQAVQYFQQILGIVETTVMSVQTIICRVRSS